VPPKPRVQAPKTRAPIEPDNAQRTRRVLYGIAGAGILGVLVVLALFAFGGSSSADASTVSTAMEAAGCTLTSAKAVPNAADHSDVPSPDMVVKAWNTNPPTTGPHYGQPAIWGAYDEPLEQARVVHNLEHGGVYIQYGDEVPEETVAELRSFYDGHRNGTLLAPLPSLGKEIALGVWVTPERAGEGSDRGVGYLAKCTAFDDAAYSAFFDQFQFKGPERFPPDVLAPGM
jgi:uncharacterized protein DUF3105